MPRYELSTITGALSSTTANTFAVNPIPYTNVISGTIAADGEACRTMKTGRPSHSARAESPMTRPANTPPTAVRSTPTTSGPAVSA